MALGKLYTIGSNYRLLTEKTGVELYEETFTESFDSVGSFQFKIKSSDYYEGLIGSIYYSDTYKFCGVVLAYDMDVMQGQCIVSGNSWEYTLQSEVMDPDTWIPTKERIPYIDLTLDFPLLISPDIVWSSLIAYNAVDGTPQYFSTEDYMDCAKSTCYDKYKFLISSGVYLYLDLWFGDRMRLSHRARTKVNRVFTNSEVSEFKIGYTCKDYIGYSGVFVGNSRVSGNYRAWGWAKSGEHTLTSQGKFQEWSKSDSSSEDPFLDTKYPKLEAASLLSRIPREEEVSVVLETSNPPDMNTIVTLDIDINGKRVNGEYLVVGRQVTSLGTGIVSVIDVVKTKRQELESIRLRAHTSHDRVILEGTVSKGYGRNEVSVQGRGITVEDYGLRSYIGFSNESVNTAITALVKSNGELVGSIQFTPRSTDTRHLWTGKNSASEFVPYTVTGGALYIRGGTFYYYGRPITVPDSPVSGIDGFQATTDSPPALCIDRSGVLHLIYEYFGHTDQSYYPRYFIYNSGYNRYLPGDPKGDWFILGVYNEYVVLPASSTVALMASGNWRNVEVGID